jgi:hypothetical protein
MKTFFLLLFIIMIKCIQSKQPIRKYVMRRDISLDGNPLPGYSIYDTYKKKLAYRLRTISTDIDTIMLVDYPKKNIMGNLEGEWADDTFNVTFSIYDYKLNQWIDGTIKKPGATMNKLTIEWNKSRLVMKEKFFTGTKIYNEWDDELLAQLQRRSGWSSTSSLKFDVKIFSDKVSDPIYFFVFAIADQHSIIHHEST